MTAAEERQLELWEKVVREAATNYHQPPLRSLEVVLACARSHHWLTEKPVWLQVVGPSSNGKSELAIAPLDGLPDWYPVGSFTPRSLLSGADPNTKGRNSALYRLSKYAGGTHGIWTMSDFSQVLDQNDHDRIEVAAQLRRIFDGSLEREVGKGGRTLKWRGKVTMIVGVTTEIERFWGVVRALGERFMRVRWPYDPGEDEDQLVEAIYRRTGRHAQVANSLRDAVREFVITSHKFPMPEIEPDGRRLISRVSRFLAKTRRGVETNKKGEIEGPKEAEAPGRIGQGLITLVRAHACLFGREAANQDDLNVAVKVVLDSLDNIQRDILLALPTDERSITWTDLKDITGSTGGPLGRAVNRLIAVGAMGKTEAQGEESRALSGYFLSSFARDVLSQINPPQSGPKLVQPLGTTPQSTPETTIARVDNKEG